MNGVRQNRAKISSISGLIFQRIILCLILLGTVPSWVNAQSPVTAFTYQGRLKHGTQYVTGQCDFEFKLFDAPTGGNQLGVTVSKTGVTVTDGFFTVLLDFGDLFTGAARYLEVSRVDCGNPGDPIALDGRIEIGAVPYTIVASTANSTDRVNWNNLVDIPGPFADNIDDGLTLTCANYQTLRWSGSGWTCINALSNHSTLLGLEDDDHLLYLPVNGIRSMEGDLNLNGNQIINVAPAMTNGQAVIYEQTVKYSDVAGGDLEGTYPNPTVAGLQGNPVVSTTPMLNQVLTWQSKRWVPANPRAGGPAGGDLGGEYPNPTVVNIQGKPVANITPDNGQVLRWNNASARWEPADVIKRADLAGGDLAGSYPNPTVVKLQGRPVQDSVPLDKQVLSWTGSRWEPADPHKGPAGGDLARMYPNPILVGIQNRPVANTAPKSNQVLAWNGLQWAPSEVTTLQGRIVSPVPPDPNQVLTWNSSNNQWEPTYVATLQRRAVPNLVPTTGQALRWNAAGALWEPGDVIKPGDAAGGHLDGTYPNPTIRPGSVGMAQLNLPMGYGFGYINLKAGSDPADLFIIPTSAGFTPSSTGKCLVSVYSHIKSTSAGVANDDPGPELRTAKDVNGTQSKDSGVGIKFVDGDTSNTQPSGASASFVWDIVNTDIGKNVKFGCYVLDPGGNFDSDEIAYCRVIYICQ